MNKEEHAYYQRQIILPEVGTAGQEKLKKSSVLVIGAGGLGCPVLDYLARAGVGTIGIVDDDKVSISNLHRQSLYRTVDVGQSKVFTASKYLLEVNPSIRVQVHPQMMRPENALKLIEGYDIIVDCTDNYATRYLVNDACCVAGKPLVYGAIYRFEGQVSVFNYQNGPTYRCLFPEFPIDDSDTNCATAGVIGILPGIIGLMQANEALKLILGIGNVLSGKLLTYNALNLNVSLINLHRNMDLDYRNYCDEGTMKHPFYEQYCEIQIEEITHSDLIRQLELSDETVLVDVCEYHEVPKWDEEGIIRVPMSELHEKSGLIPAEKKVVVFCKSGQRSKTAISKLKAIGSFDRIMSLEGGMTDEIIAIWIKRNQ